MERAEINKIYNKVRKHLEENKYRDCGVNFDFKSYDDRNDIPHITYRGERRNIDYVSLRSKSHLIVVLSPYWHEVFIPLEDVDTDELYTLLQDIYYETDESAEIGDFEIDFLNLK